MLKLGTKEVSGINWGESKVKSLYNGRNLVWGENVDLSEQSIIYDSFPTNVLDIYDFKNYIDSDIKFYGYSERIGKSKVTFGNPVTEFKDNFLDRSQINQAEDEALESGIMPRSANPMLLSISFNNFRDLKKIGDRFLYGQRYLGEIDFSGLYNVEEIGDNCLNSLTLFSSGYLHNIDFRGFENVRKIGNQFFISNMYNITEIDLSPFVSLEEVGDGFCSGVRKLTYIDTTSLKNLRKVGSYFLSDSNAETVNLSGLINVEGSYTSFANLPNLKRVIIEVEDKLLINALKNSSLNEASEGIYVPDNLVQAYRDEMSQIRYPVFNPDLFKPLSEYNPD